MSRPALRLAAAEPGQVPRLLAFRAAHPARDHRAGRIRDLAGPDPRGPHGETVVSRHRLCDLLDKLDELTGQHHDQPDGRPG